MKPAINLSIHIIFSVIFSSGLLSASAQPPIVNFNPIPSAAGLFSPIEIANAGDGSGRLFIAEKGGVIKIFKNNAVLSTPFLDISTIVSTSGEQGLLSLAFHPAYKTNGTFYVYYTNSSGAITVAQYQVSGDEDIANPTSAILVTIPKPYENHNGGHLQFRTEGGINYLYFGTGDGGSGDDPGNRSQTAGTNLGKMMRIDVDNTPTTAVEWAFGLRNPFRWSFDRLTRDMWIGDVGQNIKEEVDFLPAASAAGSNFGWRCFEGTIQNANISPACAPPDRITPVFEYDNPPGSDPSAVTGGYVYRGNEYSDLYGYYITTDFYSGDVWLLNPPGGGSASIARKQAGPVNISAFGEAEDGTLYAVSLTGNTLYKIVSVPIVPLPVTLLNFTGRQLYNYNELRWMAPSEQTAVSYIIEFSPNGINFIKAGEVPALGNNATNSYEFRHIINARGKLFYRLQIQELNGGARYSSIISVGGNDKAEVKIYSTLLRNNVIELSANIPIQKMSLYNSAGMEMYSNDLNNATGYFSIQLPAFAKGIYLVNFRGRDFNQTEKIVMQ